MRYIKPLLVTFLLMLSLGYCLPAFAVNPPTINPGYSVFSTASKTVSISASGGASIYYTTDGSTPTTSSTQYTSSFQITTSTTVKAIAEVSGVSSAVTTSFIQRDPLASSVNTSGLVAWFKADNGAITSGSNVTDWINVADNAHSASQATSASQPTVVTSAINGLPALSFDGSNDFLQVAAGISSSFSGLTVLVVTKPSSSSAGLRFIDFGNGTANNNFYLAEAASDGASLYLYNGSTASNVTASSALTQNQYQYLEATAKTNYAKIYNNGNVVGQGVLNNISGVTRNSNYIGKDSGSTLFFEGEIAEILIYNRALTDSQRAELEGYINARYQLKSGTPVISNATSGVAGSIVADSSQIMQITADPGATIYYTTDGSDPTTSSSVYSNTINVSTTTTIKAIAVQSFGTSEVASATIQIDPTTAKVSRDQLRFWFKADNGLTTNGSSVTQWTDVSGNGNNAFQIASAAQPTVVSNAINGLPAVAFNGTSQYLQLVPGLDTFLGSTIYIVMKPTSVTANAELLDFGNGSTSNNIIILEPSNNGLTYRVYSGSSPSSLTTASGITLNQFQLVDEVQAYSGGSTKLYSNGNQLAQGSVSVPSQTTRKFNYIATNNALSLFFTGEIAEMLVYGRTHDVDQHGDVEGYLGARYALFVLPPRLSISAGVYSSASVSISSDPGAQVYYTLDGSTPTASSTLYEGPFTVDQSETIKAIAIQSFGTSAVSSTTVQVDPNTTAVPRNGLELWLKADFGVTKVGTKVSQWTDWSGFGLNATQGNSSNQPDFTDNAVNGHPSITFNGSSQYLTLPSNFEDFTSGGAGCFAVIKPESSGSSFIIDIGNGAANNNLTTATNGTSAVYTTVKGTNVTTLTASPGVTLSQYQLLEGLNSNESGSIYVDGLQKTSGAINNMRSFTIRSSNHIGTNYNASSSFFQGSIAELLLYNREVTASERSGIENYLMQKYGLPQTAPPSPQISIPDATLPAPSQVTISATNGATIYYTTDGTTPTTSSTMFNGTPLQINYSQTLKAIAVRTGLVSSVSSSAYVLDPVRWPAPTSNSVPLNLHLQSPTLSIPTQ